MLMFRQHPGAKGARLSRRQPSSELIASRTWSFLQRVKEREHLTSTTSTSFLVSDRCDTLDFSNAEDPGGGGRRRCRQNMLAYAFGVMGLHEV